MEIIDELIYRNYRYNRLRRPDIPAEKFRKVYDNAEAMERRFDAEQKLCPICQADLKVWAETGLGEHNHYSDEIRTAQNKQEGKMINTTLALVQKSKSCGDVWQQMTEELGDKYGEDTPIPLSKVIEVCGVMDAIWVLGHTFEPSKKVAIELACRCAEHTLINYEKRYSGDDRPRIAIQSARDFAAGKIDKATARKVKVAARAATRSAARSAVESGRSAAKSAEWAAQSAEWAIESASELEESTESAAWSAAWTAALSDEWLAGDKSAEIEWQTKTFLELLEETPQ